MITPEQLAASGSEDGHQLALFCWAALNAETYPELKWLYAIPNGGYRDKREAAKLKAMGVKRGVPDMCLPVRRSHYAGLYIELKRLKTTKQKAGITSDDQNEWLAFLQSQGYDCHVCYGWEQAVKTLTNYLELK